MGSLSVLIEKAYFGNGVVFEEGAIVDGFGSRKARPSTVLRNRVEYEILPPSSGELCNLFNYLKSATPSLNLWS